MLPLSVRPLCTYVHLSRWRLLSKSNTFDQNFMKLGHIVQYHDVFFKLDNGPYHTRLSAVKALCLWKFTVLKDVRSPTQIFFIRILWNLVTLFSTIISSSSSIMVHITPGFQQLWPFVHENSPFWTRCPLSNSNIFIRILWNLVTFFSTVMSSSSSIMVHVAPGLQHLWPFVYENSPF